MEKIQFFPLDISYKVINNKPVILLAARTIDNKQILILDNTFQPYFYVIPKTDTVKEKLEKIRLELDNKEVAEVTKVEKIKKKYDGKEVNALKVYTKFQKDIPKIRDVIKEWEIIEHISEYDIIFTRRYLIDNNLTTLRLTEANGDFINYPSKVPVFKIKDITQQSDDMLPSPRILSFDIETYSESGEIDSEKNPIIMLSFYGENFKKIITWKKFDTRKDIDFVDSELALIEKFKEVIDQYKPDILTGYYSDGFDLPYINKRAAKYKIKLNLGVDFSELNVTHKITTSSKIFSILHIDIYKFIKRILRSQLDTELYGLNQVAEELLGEKKHDVDLSNLSKLWDNSDPKLTEYADYNLRDAGLTFRLTTKILPNMIELMKIVGLTLYDINRMGFSQLVEWYLLKNESNFNEIAPDLPNNEEIKKRKGDTFKGAFVFEPKPGLYQDILVFDFRSLYPSIISSHNISPGTKCCTCCKDVGNIPPESNQWFCMKKKGFIPSMMEDLIKRRMRIKEIAAKKDNPLLEARLTALKLLANSFYGYLGFFAARWYSLDCVKAITSYGRYYIHNVIDKAKKAGFNVIYSDTDSVFLTLGDKTKEDAFSFLEEINNSLPDLMELEYEGTYKRGIFVAAKQGSLGAKKKYALLDEEDRLKIKGFETVRRNWSPIAKEVQENILNIILRENDKEKALKYIKNIIKEFKNKSIDNDKLIIHTQLQKDIDSYDTIGPHVAIALKMKEKGISVIPGTLIQYIITEGKEKIRDKASLPEDVKEGEYDSDYYIKHQIIPAISQIFDVLGYSKEELLETKDQKKLSNF